MRVNCPRGFTLIEFVLATLTLVVAATAILGAYVGQVTLNEHARNLSLAIQDASRVIEQIRVRNTTPCQGQGGTEPTVFPPPVLPPPPPNYATWNAWLAAPAAAGGGGGLSLGTQPERLVVTCQDNASGALCGSGGAVPQVSPNELSGGFAPNHPGGDTSHDPIRVTVAVCWRHRNRTIGQCRWSGGTLVPDSSVPFPNDTTNVIESPAMLTTIVTCRSQ